MKTVLKEIKLMTGEPIAFIEIKDKVMAAVKESEIRNGFVNIITKHTTTSININEYEKGLIEDMHSFLNKFAPKEAGYKHDQNAADGRPNAHSHLITMFMNASETIPLMEGELIMGKWQTIFFVELDGPRDERNVLVNICGE